MIGVLICTHGNSAQELLKSAEMICGKQKNCQTVGFEMGESIEKLQKKLDKKLGLLSIPVICLTDLKGGTPFNTLVKLNEKYTEMDIITGVNIPMLLELFINREQLPFSELIAIVLEAGQSGIYHFQSTSNMGDDEEF